MHPQTPRVRRGAPRAARALHPARVPGGLRLAGVLVLALGLLSAPRAEAACEADTPPLESGGSVTCSGTDETGFDGGAFDDLTVTTSGTTEIDDSGAAAAGLVVGNGATVSLGAETTLRVVDTDGIGVLGGDDVALTNDGTIEVDVEGGVGVRVGPNSTTSSTSPVVNDGTIRLNAADAIGIDVGDDVNVTNSATGSITVSGDRGIAIRGGDDDFVVNDGTIVLDGDDARGIQIGDNTTNVLPNGAIANGDVTVNGARGYVIEAGDNAGTVLGGTILLAGEGSRGLSVGNRLLSSAQANHTNQGTTTVEGDGAIGLSFGDGWFSGTGADIAPDIRNFGTLTVTGAGAIGIRAGDDALGTTDNSFVLNAAQPFSGGDGLIDVTGEDAIGISVGANDFLTPSDPDLDEIFSVRNEGTLRGGADAGALVEFRSFSGTFENRLLNAPGAQITADLTNAGVANRAIAVQGTAGVERIDNRGSLTGDVLLGAGDDLFLNSGNVIGTVDFGPGEDRLRFANGAAIGASTIFDGGDDTDTLVLAFPTAFETFDLSSLRNFEVVDLEGDPDNLASDDGWALSDGNTFSGTLNVRNGTRLVAAVPTTLGGNLVMEDGAVLFTALDDSAPSLQVAGSAILDGTLEVAVPLDASEGTYTIVEATGGVGDSAFDTIDGPSSSGLKTFTTSLTANGVEVIVEIGDFANSAVAFGDNNQAIAGYLDAVLRDGGGTPALQSEIDTLATSNGSLDVVYSSISPEIYDAQSAVVMEAGRRVTRLLMNRPRACTPGTLDPWQGSRQPMECHLRKWAPWISGIGAFRSRDGFAGHPEYDARLGGVVVGLDAPPVAGFDLTLAVSTQTGSVDYRRGGHAGLTLAEVSGQAAWSHGPLRIQGVASWAHTRHDSTRSVRFDEGTEAGRVFRAVNAEEDFDSRRLILAGEVGARFDVGPLFVEPIAAVDWIQMETDGFSESGAGVYDERLESRDDDVLTVRGGLRLGTAYEHRSYLHKYLEWATGVWRPTLDLGWRQTLSGNEREVTASLDQGPGTVAPFTVDAKEDAGGFEVGLGVAFAPKYANRLQFQLRYDVYRASHTLDQDLVARIRFGF